MVNDTRELLELWSTGGANYLPRRVVAHAFGYPAMCWAPDDPDGEHGRTAEKQYINTVFRTEAEAIENARRNLLAGIRIAASRVQRARDALDVATREASQAAEELAALLAYEETRATAVKP